MKRTNTNEPLTPVKTFDEQQLFKDIFSDILWDVNFSQRTVYFSPQIREKFFSDDRTYKNFTRFWLKLFDPLDNECVNIRLKHHYENKSEEFCDKIIIKKDNNDFFCLLMRGRVVERQDNETPIRIVGALTDYTEFEKADIASNNQELLYNCVLEASPFIIAYKNREFVYLSANNAFASQLNMPGRDITGKTDYELFDKEFADNLRRDDAEVLKTGKKSNILLLLDNKTLVYGVPENYLQKASEYRWFEKQTSPVYSYHGNIIGLLVIIREVTDNIRTQAEVYRINERLESVITERTSELVLINKELESEIALRKVIEDTLRESKRILNAVIDNVPMAVFLKDVNYRYFMVNNYFKKYFPSARGKIIGYTDNEIISSDEATALRVEDEEVVKKEKTIKYIRNTVIDGIERHYDVVKFPLLDDTGKVYAICGIIHDVTGVTRIKQLIKVSEERLNYALMAANDGLWDWDIRLNNLFLSPRLYEMLGYENNSFIPTAEFMINRVHPDDKDFLFSYIEERRQLGQALDVEFRLKLLNGNWNWFQARGKFVEKDKEGNILRVVGTLTDISERKLAEEKLQDAKKHAEMLNRFKDEFITFLSHEMGNTLGLIMLSTEELLSYYERMQDNEKFADWFESLKIIERSCDNINEFIEDMVEIARIESGKMEVHKSWFDVKSLISVIVTNHGKKIEGKPIRIYQDVNVGVIYSDEKRIRQVITNFLSNAIRYTDKGKIVIEAKKTDNLVIFSVEDSGIGISQADIQKIFEPFYRSENARSVHKGMGIGLTICVKIADQLGGKVTVESVRGQGSKFSFALPLMDEEDNQNE